MIRFFFSLSPTEMLLDGDEAQMSAQTLYCACADVLNGLIKSATARHVFPLMLHPREAPR